MRRRKIEERRIDEISGNFEVTHDRRYIVRRRLDSGNASGVNEMLIDSEARLRYFATSHHCYRFKTCYVFGNVLCFFRDCFFVTLFSARVSFFCK